MVFLCIVISQESLYKFRMRMLFINFGEKYLVSDLQSKSGLQFFLRVKMKKRYSFIQVRNNICNPHI